MNNTAPKRIVTEVPIKSEVMGVKLCEKNSEKSIKRAISKEVGKEMVSSSQKNGVGTIVRVLPLGLELIFGGSSWHYVDVMLNEDSQVIQISLVGSYESIESAKEQFDAVVQKYEQKYGKGNVYAEKQAVIWTDDTNTVLLNYNESSALNGSDRSFCTLCYLNNELFKAFDKANMSDI
ncbi:MAG: hypothetical protein J5693_01245 [Bacteroidales bacterium]|nr:hypothetical protein [Bacteroidales bacterium]